MALDSGDAESFVSRIPIALDGSCSGIQNLSLAFRDEIGGAAVNIVPSDMPSDIYQLVADKAIEQLKELASGPNERTAQTDQDEEGPTDAELAQWWLDFGITRKITKRNCMTFPYGSKQRGFSDQIAGGYVVRNERLAKTGHDQWTVAFGPTVHLQHAGSALSQMSNQPKWDRQGTKHPHLATLPQAALTPTQAIPCHVATSSSEPVR